jgi:hypothetical protein
MKKNLLLALTCVAWTATYQASSDGNELSMVRRKLTKLKNGSAAIPNIFDNPKIVEMMNDTIQETIAWVNAALRKNKSDTLSKIDEVTRAKINSFIEHFTNSVNLFASVKSGAVPLQQFTQSAYAFSVDREALKQLLSKNNTLAMFRSQKKPLLRSQTRENAKQEIADVLFEYIEIFVMIAQKAIDDAANINAATFVRKKEAFKDLFAPMPEITPRKPISNTSNTQPAAQAEPTSTRDSVDWSDW